MSKPANPAIKMMDKIYKAQAKEKRADLERYNLLCGPIVTTKTKVTINLLFLPIL